MKLKSFYLIILLILTVLSSCTPSPDDSLLNKHYSYSEVKEEICSENRKSCVEIDNEVYFIDEGFLFKLDKLTNEKEYLDGFDVKEVVDYKGLVIGLQNQGAIYLLAKDEDGKRKWYQIGNSTLNIEANDSDLIALVDNGEIWAYEGQPGKIVITYVPITTITSCGKNCISTNIIMTPVINGRSIAFEKTNYSDVSEIGKDGDDIILYFSNGASREETIY